MAVTSGFFDSVSGDRKYSAQDFGKIMRGIITEGVFADYGDALTVTAPAPAGMDVHVGTGKCWFANCWVENDSELILSISAADDTNPRIDAVIVEVDLSSSTRAGDIKILTGTPAGSPVPPTPASGPLIYQYIICEVYVAALDTTIDSYNLTPKIGAGGSYPDWINFLTAGRFTRQSHEGVGINLIRNYPPIEPPQTFNPFWFKDWGTVDVLEKSAASEGISTGAPNDCVIRSVTSATMSGWKQVFDQADEPLLRPGVKVSASVWIYIDVGSAVLRLRDEVGAATIAYIALSANNQWRQVVLDNIEITNTNPISFQVYANSSGATMYAANPVFCVGEMAMPWKPRGLEYRYHNSRAAGPFDPNGIGWTTIDFTSVIGNNGVMADLTFGYYNATTAGTYLRTSPPNLASGYNDVVYATNTGTVYQIGSKTQLLDDLQQMGLYSPAVAGDTEQIYVDVYGAWVWEGSK